MSHFSAIPLEILDGETLIEALKLFGFTPKCSVDLQQLQTLKGEALQAYLKANAKHLYGYNNDRRADTAHIIVSRKQLGEASNDLGFVYNGQRWEMIISDWDRSTGTAQANGIAERGLGYTFKPRLMNEYSRLSILQTAKKLGHEATVEQVGSGYRIVVKQPVKAAKKALMSTMPQRTRSNLQSRY